MSRKVCKLSGGPQSRYATMIKQIQDRVIHLEGAPVSGLTVRPVFFLTCSTQERIL
jgi:hypothetical protein